MTASILIGSRNRVHVLERCLKSLQLQDHSDIEVLVLDDSEDPQEYNRLFKTIADPRFQLIHSPRQLGVSGSRNKLMEKANGDIYFFIDDDAYFNEKNAISLALDIFSAQPKVGILTFKIQNHGLVEREYNVPFNVRAIRQKPQLLEQSRFVGYFLGTAHAIRRDLIKECGSYNNELFFGEEELDLSYLAISFGWKIYYESKILVHHVPQPSVIDKCGHKGEELFHHIKNRFYLAYRYLPACYIPSYLGFWLVKYFVDSIRMASIRNYISGLTTGLLWLPRVQRNPLKSNAVEYLQENFGRLWY